MINLCQKYSVTGRNWFSDSWNGLNTGRLVGACVAHFHSHSHTNELGYRLGALFPTCIAQFFNNSMTTSKCPPCKCNVTVSWRRMMKHPLLSRLCPTSSTPLSSSWAQWKEMKSSRFIPSQGSPTTLHSIWLLYWTGVIPCASRILLPLYCTVKSLQWGGRSFS